VIKEFRFKAYSTEGKLISGSLMAYNKNKAKSQIGILTKRHNLRISAIEEKREFIYTVKLPNGKAVTGRQNAYTKEEVASALQRMGYQQFTIHPVLFDLKLNPSQDDVMMFIKLSTNMLKDKMSFGKILSMLAEEQSNKVMKETLLQIENQLKNGNEGKEVFKRYEDVFGRFPAFMLGLATKSGNMTEIFEATTKFIERDTEIRKSVKQALISPLFAILATLGALAYYVVDIFPSTAKMFVRFGMKTPPLTKGTLEVSDWLAKSYIFIIIGIAVPIIFLARWWSTESGKVWRDQHIIKLPLIGHLIYKQSLEIYFRVFATIYSGAGDNIETIRTAAEACRNKYMERAIKNITIPLMLKEGEAFVPAMEASEVFNRTVLTRLRTGAETGNILQAAQQISSFYEAETTYKMKALIEYIQTFVGLFIAVAITFLTVVSAEIATVSPPSPH
jgi:type IV pilus assembly protein PilC